MYGSKVVEFNEIKKLKGQELLKGDFLYILCDKIKKASKRHVNKIRW